MRPRVLVSWVHIALALAGHLQNTVHPYDTNTVVKLQILAIHVNPFYIESRSP
jgi:hypothetical protein